MASRASFLHKVILKGLLWIEAYEQTGLRRSAMPISSEQCAGIMSTDITTTNDPGCNEIHVLNVNLVGRSSSTDKTKRTNRRGCGKAVTLPAALKYYGGRCRLLQYNNVE